MTTYELERKRNRRAGRTHEITIRTRVPSKWRFVDLETGDVWIWSVAGSTFKRDREWELFTNRLKTLTDIATLFGISRQHAFKLTGRGDFPDPAYTSSAGRLWWAKDVKRWFLDWPRKVGRPRKTEKKPGPTGGRAIKGRKSPKA